ncbi:hypothetical protein BC828DRAFT_419305 [Blastocladiella britannica]|nr:hypothetical protein BC828DRAFT_419305 [Blastocladiella britannica]
MASFLRDGFQPDMDLHAALRDENLDLKRKLNAQVDLSKRLNTRVQKMSEDMAKLKITASIPQSAYSDRPGTPDGMPSSALRTPTVVAARTIVHRRNPSLEALVDDLRTQMRDQAKENASLKAKVQHFRALHDATLRKRGKWDAIGPKVPSRKPAALETTRSPVKSAQSSMSSVARSVPILDSPPLPLKKSPSIVPFTETAEYHDLTATIQILRLENVEKETQLLQSREQIEHLSRALEVADAKAAALPDKSEFI